MAVLPPMPMASVSIAVIANVGARRSARHASRRSRSTPSFCSKTTDDRSRHRPHAKRNRRLVDDKVWRVRHGGDALRGIPHSEEEEHPGNLGLERAEVLT